MRLEPRRPTRHREVLLRNRLQIEDADLTSRHVRDILGRPHDPDGSVVGIDRHMASLDPRCIRPDLL